MFFVDTLSKYTHFIASDTVLLMVICDSFMLINFKKKIEKFTGFKL